MPTHEFIEATALADFLTQATGQQSPSYARLKIKMYSGTIPFTKLPNGRLAVRRADTPLILERLGLTPLAPVPALKPRPPVTGRARTATPAASAAQ